MKHVQSFMLEITCRSTGIRKLLRSIIFSRNMNVKVQRACEQLADGTALRYIWGCFTVSFSTLRDGLMSSPRPTKHRMQQQLTVESLWTLTLCYSASIKLLGTVGFYNVKSRRKFPNCSAIKVQLYCASQIIFVASSKLENVVSRSRI